MPRPYRVLNNCPSGKLAFTTRAKAAKWLRQRKHHTLLRPVTSYECERCGLWHLTSRRR